MATLTPSQPLSASTTYTATITGGSAGVKDAAGNALAANFVASFTTAAASTARQHLERDGGAVAVCDIR